jgi:hypothetical protein
MKYEVQHWRHYNPQPQCNECGRFIPYKRATLKGKLEGQPCVGWVEWFSGLCVKCETRSEEDEI